MDKKVEFAADVLGAAAGAAAVAAVTPVAGTVVGAAAGAAAAFGVREGVKNDEIRGAVIEQLSAVPSLILASNLFGFDFW